MSVSQSKIDERTKGSILYDMNELLELKDMCCKASDIKEGNNLQEKILCYRRIIHLLGYEAIEEKDESGLIIKYKDIRRIKCL